MPSYSERNGPSFIARTAALGVAFIALASGCASTPSFVAVNHQQIIPLPEAEIWRRLHAFLQDQNISVISEDAAAGVINARQAVLGHGLLTSYADCGGGGLLHPLQRQTLDLTILLKPAPDGSKVTVNAAFSETLSSRRAVALTIACRSNGVLEAAVLNVASGQPMEAAVVPR